MRTIWNALVCLVHHESCDGFTGDEHTDYLRDRANAARDQELAAWREVDRISVGRQKDLSRFRLTPPRRDGDPR